MSAYRENAKTENEYLEFSDNVFRALNPAKTTLINEAEQLLKIVAAQISKDTGCETKVINSLGAIRLVVKNYSYGDDDLFRILFGLIIMMPHKRYFKIEFDVFISSESNKYYEQKAIKKHKHRVQTEVYAYTEDEAIDLLMNKIQVEQEIPESF